MYEDFPWVFVMTWFGACRAKNPVKIIDNDLFIYLGAVYILCQKLEQVMVSQNADECLLGTKVLLNSHMKQGNLSDPQFF